MRRDVRRYSINIAVTLTTGTFPSPTGTPLLLWNSSDAIRKSAITPVFDYMSFSLTILQFPWRCTTASPNWWRQAAHGPTDVLRYHHSAFKVYELAAKCKAQVLSQTHIKITWRTFKKNSVLESSPLSDSALSGKGLDTTICFCFQYYKFKFYYFSQVNLYFFKAYLNKWSYYQYLVSL